MNGSTGGRLDPNRIIGLSFNGRPYQGFPGDTLPPCTSHGSSMKVRQRCISYYASQSLGPSPIHHF